MIYSVPYFVPFVLNFIPQTEGSQNREDTRMPASCCKFLCGLKVIQNNMASLLLFDSSPWLSPSGNLITSVFQWKNMNGDSVNKMLTHLSHFHLTVLYQRKHWLSGHLSFERNWSMLHQMSLIYLPRLVCIFTQKLHWFFTHK